MISSHSSLYRQSPFCVQEEILALNSRLRAALTARSMLKRTAASIERSQWLAPAQWQALQLESVRKLAEHARQRVPYYRELFAQAGIDPARWQHLDDLREIPCLTKQDVIGYIDDCVNNSGYSLVPEFRNLWAYTNKCTVEDFPFTAGQGLKWVEDDAAVNPESMFAIKYNKLASWSTTIGYGNGYALHFGVRGNDQANSFPFGQGWGAGPVAPNFYNDWSVAEQDDARRPASVFKTEDMPSYNKGGGDGFIQETDYYQMKIGSIMAYSTDAAGNKTIEPVFEKIMYGADGWINDNLMQTGSIHDLVLIRFADVLLMQSELKEDVSGINRVRSRAGLEPIGTYSLAALQNERRWELCFEGTRWNDIRRWHIAADALERQTGAKVYTNGAESRNVAQNGGYAARYKATAGFQKIPENQVLLNEGKVEQNEGYTDASAEYNGWQE